MNISDLKIILEEVVHDTLYTCSKLNKKQKGHLREIKEYLRNTNNFIDDLRTIISSRTNENYFVYDNYIKDFLLDSSSDIKLEILKNQENYSDIIRDSEIYVAIWSSLNISEKVLYLEEKKRYTDIDTILLKSSVIESGNFKENILLNEILKNEDIRNKIEPFSIELNYSYNLLSLINLVDYDMCSILSKETYTKFLLKKCKTFEEFLNLYNGNKKIFNLISNNSLIFKNEDNEGIYNFILNNPNFIGKFNAKYLDLFSMIEITKISKNTNLDSDTYSVVLQRLFKFNEDDADEYFSEENLNKCSKHSITSYPFNNISSELKQKIFNTYSLFNRFIDTIMIEAINNNFNEDDIVNILRNDTFIIDTSSYAIELLLNKLSFKSAFNMLQRKVIFNKISNLNVKVDEKDTIFIKGFLDSPILVYKSEHNMLYEMLNLLNTEDLSYYIMLPYIINGLSNYEIINLVINKNLNVHNILNSEELNIKLNLTDIINLIDRLFEKNVDLTIFNNKNLAKNLFGLSDSQFESINFDEVSYLFETIRMKSILSKQESKLSVLTYKSILASYLVFGLDETINIVNTGNSGITLNEIKYLQKDIIDEKILAFKENNSPVFQNMAKKIIHNLSEIDVTDDINEFAINVRKNTYLDNIIYLMLDNNFDSYNGIIDKLYGYVKYFSYDAFASNKEIYDYTKRFTAVYLERKVKEYNCEFEKIIFSNFKVRENIIYNKRKEIGKDYLKKLKFKLFVRALTDSNKDSYAIYFKANFPINEIKTRYLKVLANNDVDFESILEHVLIPTANERFDKENCLNKLGINKPLNTDEYTKYLLDLKSITELNMKIDKYKEYYSTEELISIMNYICYKSKINFDIDKKHVKEFDRMATLVIDLDGEIYVDKSALKFIYKDNMDIYNIEEIIEYRNYIEILDDILKKTHSFINRTMDDNKIRSSYSHEYFKAINTDNCVFPITPKYYEPKKRVFALKDLETIFNGYDLSNYRDLDESLKNFLFNKKNLIMVVDGYYNGIVDNLGIIISKWDKIMEYAKTLDCKIEDLSLISIENILTLINFEDNVFGKSIDRMIIKDICEDGYYEVNDLNKRIDILIDLFKATFKVIKKSVPYLCYRDDVYRVEVLDTYHKDILKCMNGSLYKVGAIGNDFLHYSILNKNGFQLGIYKDDILVAKILGIRNGNTVYLNALEGNKDENYNELLRLFANQMISITRSDVEPIEFVSIVNNENYSSRNGLKLDTTICPVINDPINKVYYDFEKFSEYENLINIEDIYTNYKDNISTLLASSNIVDKNNFKYYDADGKYYRIRNNVIKLSNNIGEEYLNKIDTILYLCKMEDEKVDLNNITLTTMKNIYLGDDYVLFVTEKNHVLKFALPYDERANKEIALIMEAIENE